MSVCVCIYFNHQNVFVKAKEPAREIERERKKEANSVCMSVSVCLVHIFHSITLSPHCRLLMSKKGAPQVEEDKDAPLCMHINKNRREPFLDTTREERREKTTRNNDR